MCDLKIMLDTDMGSDCDDVGALSLLHSFSNMNKLEILSVTHCASEIGGAVTVKAINEFFGKGDIPVGRYVTKPFLEEDCCKIYTSVISSDYLLSNEMPSFEPAVRVMRRCLAGNRGVTMISIGMLNNFVELLESSADDISPLTGVELISLSVKELYVMGGNFENLDMAEYNIKSDVQAAQKIATCFPAPIIYCGFELGEKVLTGECFKKDANPMGKAYSIYSENGIRESWDPITVFCAIEHKSDLFTRRENKTITFTDEGKVVLRDGGKDSYVVMKGTVERISEAIEKCMYIK